MVNISSKIASSWAPKFKYRKNSLNTQNITHCQGLAYAALIVASMISYLPPQDSHLRDSLNCRPYAPTVHPHLLARRCDKCSAPIHCRRCNHCQLILHWKSAQIYRLCDISHVRQTSPRCDICSSPPTFVSANHHFTPVHLTSASAMHQY